MYKVEIIQNGQRIAVRVEKGTLLSSVLIENSTAAEHLCGCKGLCKKCTVFVKGKSELSCQYIIDSDICVEVPEESDIESVTGMEESDKLTDNVCLCFDIGTTSLALALVSLDEHRIIGTVTKSNPQRIFGADVMSRIDYSTKYGTAQLHNTVIAALNQMINELLKRFGLKETENLYVAGNTAMLHLFFGIDCSSMGVSPYTPSFLESKTVKAENLGIKRIKHIISLPGISAFVGSDIVAGLGFIGFSKNGKYNLLIDLGTNAEVVLFSDNKILCTAAAAGPCFEGANISCGMSASKGAIYEYSDEGYSVIGNTEPCGICATGLINVIAALIETEVVDETGYMECGVYRLTENVSITQKDIRQFQLAKSAVYSAVITLMNKAEISFDDIENMYVSGGFSGKMNISDAVKTGLLPRELKNKFTPINNSSLLGTVKYAYEKNIFSVFTENAEYVDLSADVLFGELFIENMLFQQ